ncbi:lactonase family protein [Granulicella sp. dw_53]|uniref:lactonase family protein n=1 Tax=Granulicella sp. dw_53 TaxID=2719792 RepID=UPI001BD512C4|nr:lactonase family protein [Granulicella sp. dw_53]
MKSIRSVLCLSLTACFMLLIGRSASAEGKEFFVYSGTYTGFKSVHNSLPVGAGESHSKGIYVSRFNAATGELGEPQLAVEILNPSFITISPNHRFLYAVVEDPTSVGPPLDHASYVSSFAIDAKTGKLSLLNTLPSGGTSTCFIAMDKTGHFVFMAHFGSGSVSVLRVKADGSLGEQTSFMQHIGHSVALPVQAFAHPHSVIASPDNRHVVVSDLGQDKLFVYDFDEKTGLLSPPEPNFATVAPGSGPRHFTFDPAGKFGYQLSEMSGAVDVFSWNPAGKLSNIQTARPAVPAGFDGDVHSAEIEISPNGKFLYESNRRTHEDGPRGPDTIGVFAIDPIQGTLTEVQQSATGGLQPRSFALDPTGNFLLAANEATNSVVVYKIDGGTGKLSPTGKTVVFDTPVCLKFVPVER